jgi:hypothetical protein
MLLKTLKNQLANKNQKKLKVLPNLMLSLHQSHQQVKPLHLHHPLNQPLVKLLHHHLHQNPQQEKLHLHHLLQLNLQQVRLLHHHLHQKRNDLLNINDQIFLCNLIYVLY